MYINVYQGPYEQIGNKNSWVVIGPGLDDTVCEWPQRCFESEDEARQMVDLLNMIYNKGAEKKMEEVRVAIGAIGRYEE